MIEQQATQPAESNNKSKLEQEPSTELNEAFQKERNGFHRIIMTSKKMFEDYEYKLDLALKVKLNFYLNFKAFYF